MRIAYLRTHKKLVANMRFSIGVLSYFCPCTYKQRVRQKMPHPHAVSILLPKGKL